MGKAEQAAAGKAPVKWNRFIQLPGGTKSVNRELEARVRALAGLKGYITNLATCPDGTSAIAEFVIDAYDIRWPLRHRQVRSNPTTIVTVRNPAWPVEGICQNRLI